MTKIVAIHVSPNGLFSLIDDDELAKIFQALDAVPDLKYHLIVDSYRENSLTIFTSSPQRVRETLRTVFPKWDIG